MPGTHRRRFLGTIFAGGTTALAGCSVIDGEEPSTEEEAPPEFRDDDAEDEEAESTPTDSTGTWRDWILASDPRTDGRLFRLIDHEQLFDSFTSDSDMYRGMMSRSERFLEQFGAPGSEISFELEHHYFADDAENIDLFAHVFVGSFDGEKAAERFSTEIRDDYEITGTESEYTVVEGEGEFGHNVFAFGDDAVVNMMGDAQYLEAQLDGTRRIEATRPAFGELFDTIPGETIQCDGIWIADDDPGFAEVFGSYAPGTQIETRDDEHGFITTIFDSTAETSASPVIQRHYPTVDPDEFTSQPDVSIDIDGRIVLIAGDITVYSA